MSNTVILNGETLETKSISVVYSEQDMLVDIATVPEVTPVDLELESRRKVFVGNPEAYNVSALIPGLSVVFASDKICFELNKDDQLQDKPPLDRHRAEVVPNDLLQGAAKWEIIEYGQEFAIDLVYEFPTNWQDDSDTTVIMQIHGDNNIAPPVSWITKNGNIYLRTRANDSGDTKPKGVYERNQLLAPIPKGGTIRLTSFIEMHNSEAAGHVITYVDGEKQDHFVGRVGYSSDDSTAYAKAGFYKPSWSKGRESDSTSRHMTTSHVKIYI